MKIELIERLSQQSSHKTLLCVLDGLGGLPGPDGLTALESASTPNLDKLAAKGSQGRTLPVGYGITPGSGPGHLALFGYDPLEYVIGRGALEATGIDFILGPDDVVARGNFCDVNGNGIITDRRAGRQSTEITAGSCELLSQIKLSGIDTFVLPVREQRFVLVLRGPNLSESVSETDPQIEGVPPSVCGPLTGSVEAERTASLIRRWVNAAHDLLKDREQGNGILLRGWSSRPNLPSFPEIWKTRAAACAVYPMYRGVASLAGMDVINAGASLSEQIHEMTGQWNNFDFFFLHYKYADSAGEDGDFDAKVQAIAEFDIHVPDLLRLNPEVIVVTGDHSTPAVMSGHSWHSVPTLIAGRHVRPDAQISFGERAAISGELGQFPANELLPIAFAHADKLAKFGA
tara:strand:- start:2043 stop:3248 length:1206 start_codon:yes stop_codon:yes gene_type:complete